MINSLTDVEFAVKLQDHIDAIARSLKDGAKNSMQQTKLMEKFISDNQEQYNLVIGTEAQSEVNGIISKTGSFIDCAFSVGILDQTKEELGSSLNQIPPFNLGG